MQLHGSPTQLKPAVRRYARTFPNDDREPIPGPDPERLRAPLAPRRTGATRPGAAGVDALDRGIGRRAAPHARRGGTRAGRRRLLLRPAGCGGRRRGRARRQHRRQPRCPAVQRVAGTWKTESRAGTSGRGPHRNTQGRGRQCRHLRQWRDAHARRAPRSRRTAAGARRPRGTAAGAALGVPRAAPEGRPAARRQNWRKAPSRSSGRVWRTDMSCASSSRRRAERPRHQHVGVDPQSAGASAAASARRAARAAAR